MACNYWTYLHTCPFPCRFNRQTLIRSSERRFLRMRSFSHQRPNEHNESASDQCLVRRPSTGIVSVALRAMELERAERASRTTQRVSDALTHISTCPYVAGCCGGCNIKLCGDGERRWKSGVHRRLPVVRREPVTAGHDL